MSENGLSLFDFQPGKVLKDRFEVVRPLRQSGMSQTFEVRDREEGAPRELLVFPGSLFEGPRQSEDFAARMRAWREVQSPAVVRVCDVLRYPDGALLVSTELPPPRSLRQWLNERGPMDTKLARKLGLELCVGLAAIHAAGLVHGDIKPTTIHVEGDAKPAKALFVDGGITPGLWSAKHLGDRTVLIGTPFYAPVEQFGGESPNVQSDLYNLATVLYELAVGKVPWAGRNFLEVFQAKLGAPATMKTRAPDLDVPAAYEEVVRRGIQADGRERYQSAEEFRAALTKVKL